MELAVRPSGDILRRNPQQDYELIQRVGSGTYGDVYKKAHAKYFANGDLPRKFQRRITSLCLEAYS